jgi:HSP20 family protein
MLSRWDSVAEVRRLEDALFRSPFGPRGASERAPRHTFVPVVDVFEDGDAILVQADLPGLTLEEVSVRVANDLLTLSGERKQEREGHSMRERWFGAFSRTFKLPSTIDVERIEATLKDGVLTVRMPKRESLKARKIEVKS